MTNLSEVMGIFSDILTKSRFEQRPTKGNFIPRPKAKENTSVIITKESPIQGPGTPPKRSRSSKEVTGRGKKAGREFISDGANPDDATFVEGIEKANGEDDYGLSADENADHFNEELFRRRNLTRQGFVPKYGEAGSEVYDRSRPPNRTRQRQLQDRYTRELTEDHRLNMEKSDDAREAAKYQTRGKRKPSVMERRKPVTPTPKDPNAPKRGKWEGGAWVQELANMLKAFGVIKADRPPLKPGENTPHRENTREYGNPQTTVPNITDRREYVQRNAPLPKGTAYQVSDSGKPDPDDPHPDAPREGKRRGLGFGNSSESESTKPKKRLGFKTAFLEAMLKSYSWHKHGLHPATKRPKTVTEKSDGGEEYSSGARVKTSAVLGMLKASKKIKAIKDMTHEELVQAHRDGTIRINTRHREGSPPYSMPGTQPRQPVQDELPFSTEDRDHIAPTPEAVEPHGDNLPEPRQRGGPRPGSRRKGEIPKEGWKEAALLWPAQSEKNGKGRKVKSRIGDYPDGYPT